MKDSIYYNAADPHAQDRLERDIEKARIRLTELERDLENVRIRLTDLERDIEKALFE